MKEKLRLLKYLFATFLAILIIFSAISALYHFGGVVSIAITSFVCAIFYEAFEKR